MKENDGGLQSLFAGKLDRAIFSTYFLGAIIPMAALGYVVQRFALPAMEGESYGLIAVVGPTAGVSMLSLVAFLALRRLVANAVGRMDADNGRLAVILRASQELSVAPHLHAAADVAAGCASSLTGARAVLVMRRGDPGKPFELCASAGEDSRALLEAFEDECHELVETTMKSGRSSSVRAIGQYAAISFPLGNEINGHGAILVAVPQIPAAIGSSFAPGVVDAMTTLATLTAVALDSAELKDSQQNFFTHATEIMVAALDAHVGHTDGGAHEVAQLANRIGRELGLDDETLRRVHFASLLSDIGMLKLSAAQRQNPNQLAKHPVIGHRMLSRIKLWSPIAEIVLRHHDHFDGSVSSAGAEEAPLSLESRIIHVADAFTRMTADGAEGAQMTPDAGLEELQQSQGTQFDPTVVDALARLVGRGELAPDADQ